MCVCVYNVSEQVSAFVFVYMHVCVRERESGRYPNSSPDVHLLISQLPEVDTATGSLAQKEGQLVVSVLVSETTGSHHLPP